MGEQLEEGILFAFLLPLAVDAGLDGWVHDLDPAVGRILLGQNFVGGEKPVDWEQVAELGLVLFIEGQLLGVIFFHQSEILFDQIISFIVYLNEINAIFFRSQSTSAPAPPSTVLCCLMPSCSTSRISYPSPQISMKHSR